MDGLVGTHSPPWLTDKRAANATRVIDERLSRG